MHGLPITRVSSTEILELIQGLPYPAVITKNKDEAAEENYRISPSRLGRVLDGFWKGQPRQVEPGAAYGLHFVERRSLLFIGDYIALEPGEEGRNSLVLEGVEGFEITDLREHGGAQTFLLDILKQPGAVTYSYFPKLSKPDESSVADEKKIDVAHGQQKFAQVKVRPSQILFRKRVFAKHGRKCFLTGCTVAEMLDAAHLTGRSWQLGHNSGDDGIPLRADLHRAYDAKLIEIDPTSGGIVNLDPSLRAAFGALPQELA